MQHHGRQVHTPSSAGCFSGCLGSVCTARTTGCTSYCCGSCATGEAAPAATALWECELQQKHREHHFSDQKSNLDGPLAIDIGPQQTRSSPWLQVPWGGKQVALGMVAWASSFLLVGLVVSPLVVKSAGVTVSPAVSRLAKMWHYAPNAIPSPRSCALASLLVGPFNLIVPSL